MDCSKNLKVLDEVALVCPRCRKPELIRHKIAKGKIWVLFKCMFTVLLPDEPDESLQKKLDAWEFHKT